MAFFKFRQAGADASSPPSQPESIDAVRKRAKHRLIGAAVLVLVAVIGFPLLFDTQPRPIAVDIPIEIPDRNKVKPLQAPAADATAASGTVAAARTSPAPAVSGVVTQAASSPATVPAAKVTETPKVEAAPQPQAPVVAKAVPKAAEPPPEKAPEKAAAKAPEPKASAAAAPKPDDGAKALALLEGKAPPADHPVAADGRFVVQVGAFADAAKARETRLKVEKAGLKTYTHVAETKEGKRIRVRVGPFATRGEADKAADKIKGLDLPAAILTL